MSNTEPLFTLSAPFRVGMIWAQTPERVIGSGGTLPWRVPEDLAHFKSLTLGHYVLHGRSSYEALPRSLRPLPGRNNIVLTTQKQYTAPGAHVVHSLPEAYTATGGQPLWIVGGGQVYQAAMEQADTLVITEIDLDIDGDTYAPRIEPSMWEQRQTTSWYTSTTGVKFRIQEYRRPQ